MLVLHQTSDPSTDFLRVLYEGREGCTCLQGEDSRKKVESAFYHLKAGEPIMLLGHGTDAGLFRLERGKKGEQRDYRCYVGRSMAYCLRKHPVIGIWCHANLFAESFGLSGLFTGMVISQLDEARTYGVPTTEEELERENLLFASTLAKYLDAGIPFSEIPARMCAEIGDGPAVRKFNFNSLFAL